MNIASAIDGHRPDSVALIDGDQEIDYATLGLRVAAVRSGMAAAGVSAGVRVLIVGDNEVEFVVAVLAALGLGAHVAPIRASNPEPEVRRKAASIDPAIVVCCSTAAWLLTSGFATEYELHAVAELALSDPQQDPGVTDRAPGDIAVLLLTSGVTSDAKVAVLSHGNLDWIQSAVVSHPDNALGPDDVALGLLPLTHIFGLNVVLLSMLRIGGSIVLQNRFDPRVSMQLIERHGVTTVTGAPQMWQRLLATDVEGNPLSSVRRATSGAASLSVQTFNGVRDRFGIELAEGYGLTETSPIVTWSRGVRPRAGSVGVALDGVEIAIVETDGTPVDPGDVGEIVVRSPGVFMGYLDAPEATAKVLTEDGWFWTGDMGVFDADNFLYLVDRIKDIVIVSGFNVYPAEVEGVLMEHPDVKGAIVVGASDERTGEAVVAHVSGQVNADELDAFCRERLSSYKCPREFNVVEELPVSSTGKPIRRALRS